MTDENQVKDQDVELHDDENEIIKISGRNFYLFSSSAFHGTPYSFICPIAWIKIYRIFVFKR